MAHPFHPTSLDTDERHEHPAAHDVFDVPPESAIHERDLQRERFANSEIARLVTRGEDL